MKSYEWHELPYSIEIDDHSYEGPFVVQYKRSEIFSESFLEHNPCVNSEHYCQISEQTIGVNFQSLPDCLRWSSQSERNPRRLGFTRIRVNMAQLAFD